MHAFQSIAASLLLTGLAFAACSQDNPVLVGTVTKVTDGDTIKVQLSSGAITVRFDSIDTQYKKQPGLKAGAWRAARGSPAFGERTFQSRRFPGKDRPSAAR
jgi:endonuclease YncB( thermonuclease family)